MTVLPPSSDFTTAGITKAQFRSALTSLRAYLSGLFGDAGTQAAALSGLGAPFNATLSKSAAYTVVAADRGKLIDCTTGTWTLALDAAVTLGAGFMFGFRNSGAGTLTINPNLSEQIDGAATITVGPGESGVVLCDGTGLKTVGKTLTPLTPAILQVVSTTIPVASGNTTIPDDTTTPLSTEGTQIASLSITPSSASNSVRLRASFSAVAVSQADGCDRMICAVFRGTTLIGTARASPDAATLTAYGAGTVFAFEFEDAPASASAVTYTVRFGLADNSNGSSWMVNRTNASATALASSMANSRFYAEELAA